MRQQLFLQALVRTSFCRSVFRAPTWFGLNNLVLFYFLVLLTGASTVRDETKSTVLRPRFVRCQDPVTGSRSTSRRGCNNLASSSEGNVRKQSNALRSRSERLSAIILAISGNSRTSAANRFVRELTRSALERGLKAFVKRATQGE